MEIYVGNLPWSVTSEDLHALFSKFGEVTAAEVKTMIDDRSGRPKSRGFGFVSMSNATEAQSAIAEYNGYDMNGRPLVVNEARPREEGAPRQGGFNGGNRGGYGRNDDRGGFRPRRDDNMGGGHMGAFAPQAPHTEEAGE